MRRRFHHAGLDHRRKRGFRPLVRSFRRWQLYKLQRFFYESHYPLGMHLGLRYPRRSHVAPNER